jgi:hypothetical protein
MTDWAWQLVNGPNRILTPNTTYFDDVNQIINSMTTPVNATEIANKAYVDAAIGGAGTVTDVSVVTANGVSGTVATATTTPAITLVLGAITPSSVASTGTVTGTNLSGTNTGDGAQSGTAIWNASEIQGNAVAAGTPTSGQFYAWNTGASQFQLTSPSGAGTVTSVSVVTANGVSGTVATPTTTPAITLVLGAITPSSVAATGTVTGSNLSGTNTGNQTITLTGPITGSGTGSIATTIATSAVGLTKLAIQAGNTLVGNFTGSTASPTAVTYSTAQFIDSGGVFSLVTPTNSFNGSMPAVLTYQLANTSAPVVTSGTALTTIGTFTILANTLITNDDNVQAFFQGVFTNALLNNIVFTVTVNGTTISTQTVTANPFGAFSTQVDVIRSSSGALRVLVNTMSGSSGAAGTAEIDGLNIIFDPTMPFNIILEAQASDPSSSATCNQARLYGSPNI